MASKSFEAPDTSNMKEKDILLHVERAIEFLHGTTDYSTVHVGDALWFLYDVDRYTGEYGECVKEATKLGLAKLFVKITTSLEDHFQSCGKTQGADNLDRMEKVFWNFTGAGPELGCDLGKCGAINHIITTLNMLSKRPESKLKTDRVNALLGILDNSIFQRHCRCNRSIYRKAGAVDILTKFAKSTTMIIKVKSLLALAYIVDEEESEILGRDSKAIGFLVEMLKTGVDASNHKVYVGSVEFPLSEVLDGLIQLTINDANKKVVFKAGGITVIRRMLSSNFTKEEQMLAAKSLWNLSFDETIRESDEIKESLEALKLLTNSEDKALRTVSKNALWAISGESFPEKEHTQPKQDVSPKPKADTKKDEVDHVMISYNWTHQKQAFKIRDDLEKDGYKVWIDVDKLEDDILESMAKAVMKSSVILLCMSQRYHASQSCRSEATYAYKKKKPVIPLLVEADYNPEGWLDILIGAKLYYKFSSDKEMGTNMSAMKKGIDKWYLKSARTRGSASVDDPDGPIKAQHVSTENAAPPSQRFLDNRASSWSKERVQKWFEEIKLPQLKSSLDFCNGGSLEDMYKEYSRDAHAFAEDYRSELGLKNIEMLRLTTALKELFM